MRADRCSQCHSDKLLTDRRTSVAMFTATAAPSRVDKSGANQVRVPGSQAPALELLSLAANYRLQNLCKSMPAGQQFT